MKPDIIYLTGAPGSGKTQLARALNEKLYSYTHIDPDDLLQSFWEHNTENPDYDREKVGIPRMQRIIESLLADDVRLIVDSQPDIDWLKKISQKYRLINLHCQASNPAERFYNREVSPDGTVPDWLEEHMPKIKLYEKEAKEPIDFGQKIIIVNCDNGYSPTIEEIVKLVDGVKQ